MVLAQKIVYFNLGRSKNMFTDYYQILNIDRKATEEEIRKAYWDLAKKYHPDQNDNPAAHKRFIEIKKAYEVLINSESRSKFNSLYDRQNNIGTAGSYVPIRSKSGASYGRGKHRGRRYNRRSGTTRKAPREPIRRERPVSMGPEYDFGGSAQRERQAEVLGSGIGYTYFAWFARLAAACTLLLTIAVIGDFFLAQESEPEQVENTRLLPWTMTQPEVLKVKTTHQLFDVHSTYHRYVRLGRTVRLKITPFGKNIVRIYAYNSDGTKVSFRPSGGLYGVTFFLVMILMILSITTLMLRKSAELASYVGTINLLLFVIIFSVIKNA